MFELIVLSMCQVILLWRRKWQPTPVFLPGESRGQRSLTGYSPRGHKESDMTEAFNTQVHTVIPSAPSFSVMCSCCLPVIKREVDC